MGEAERTDVEAPVLDGADPTDLARIVAEASEKDLRATLTGDYRARALEEIFNRMERHFKPHAAGDTEAVIHFRIGGRDVEAHDEYEVVVKGGACSTSRGLSEPDPRVVLELDDIHFLRLVTGNASGPMLFMRRKLKIDGDVMFASRITSLFSIPKA